MPTTTYVDSTFAASVIGARTDAAGDPVSDLSAEEARFPAVLLVEGYLTPATAFQVTAQAVPDMTVKVGSGASKADYYVVAGGTAGQGNYIVRLDVTSEDVTIDAADASQVRTDEVWLVVRDNTYDVSSLGLPQIGYRKGDVGGANPGPDAGWEAAALLARVTVPAAATEITNSDITDMRTAGGTGTGNAITAVDYQVFTSSGTWNKPAGASQVFVQVVGGGGGGGGATTSSDKNSGGGGGGGGCATKLFDASDLGSTETVTIGAGGSGGAEHSSSAGDGGDGGTSSFATLSATGGAGGSGASSASGGGDGGYGGDASGGDVNANGGHGLDGLANEAMASGSSPFGGVGGASAFNGSAATAGDLGSGGGGGDAIATVGVGRSGGGGVVIVTTYIR